VSSPKDTPKPARKPRAGKTAGTTPAADAATAPHGDHVKPAPLFVAHLDVRWRDLDAFNHVNNSTYLTYLEEARLQWLRHVPGPWFDESSMPVLAASNLNYRQPIAWPGHLAVELYCERLGNSSITLAHRIVDAEDGGQLYCDGHVVLVWMNPATGKPVPLPQAIRDSAAAAAA
jgi:acyl-CoA thioester hydrolase